MTDAACDDVEQVAEAAVLLGWEAGLLEEERQSISGACYRILLYTQRRRIVCLFQIGWG